MHKAPTPIKKEINTTKETHYYVVEPKVICGLNTYTNTKGEQYQDITMHYFNIQLDKELFKGNIIGQEVIVYNNEGKKLLCEPKLTADKYQNTTSNRVNNLVNCSKALVNSINNADLFDYQLEKCRQENAPYEIFTEATRKRNYPYNLKNDGCFLSKNQHINLRNAIDILYANDKIQQLYDLLNNMPYAVVDVDSYENQSEDIQSKINQIDDKNLDFVNRQYDIDFENRNQTLVLDIIHNDNKNNSKEQLYNHIENVKNETINLLSMLTDSLSQQNTTNELDTESQSTISASNNSQ